MLGLCMLFMLLDSFLAIGAPARDDQAKQKVSLAQIVCLRVAIEAYQQDHLQVPTAIEDLAPEYLKKTEVCSTDGWGRRLLYYGLRTHYLLMSLGRNGVPDHAVGESGEFQANDYDQDTVLIDGEWVRLPSGHCAH